jgi:alkanesulfonate monooxygenase SsuD/methylene tetrahydromethanopterin reductase-like flavin-dependent oxidoreductase (luciferase family)
MGFEQEAARVQELFLAGQHRDAAQAVPFEFIDATALIGSPERIGQRLGRYADAGVTTLGVSPFAMSIEERLDTLRVMSELVPSTTEEAPTT